MRHIILSLFLFLALSCAGSQPTYNVRVYYNSAFSDSPVIYTHNARTVTAINGILKIETTEGYTQHYALKKVEAWWFKTECD